MSLVSICIPTYNGSKHLEACLDSVISQTYQNTEIIIVDDQSTDMTWELLNQYATKDNRIRLFRNETNLGLVGNWNRCIELAKGEWIKFVFQDDWLDRDCLRKMVATSEADGALLTVCRREFVFELVNDLVIAEYEKFSNHFSPEGQFPNQQRISSQEFCGVLLKHPAVNFLGEPTAMLIHSNAITHYGIFNPEFIQLCDLEYWARIGCNAGISYVPETLAYFRVHKNSTTSTNETNHTYLKNVIDPLRLSCEFAYSPQFLALRQTANAKHISLPLIFRTALLNEQIDAYQNDQAKSQAINAWINVRSSYSCMTLTSFLPLTLSILLKRLERKWLYICHRQLFKHN